MKHLPYDYARCHGNGCERRDTCLRFTETEHGQRSAWMHHYCSPEWKGSEFGDLPEIDGYIPVEQGQQGDDE